MTFQLRGGRSELRWSKDLDARRLCSIRQNLLALNPIWCGSDRTDHDIDTLKCRREGGPVVIIDGGEPGTLCDPFRVRRTWILEVREYKSGSQRRLHGRREIRTGDRETMVIEDTVPMTFNLNSSVTTKFPTFPAPITAKERKTISSFAGGRRDSQDGDYVLPMGAAQLQVAYSTLSAHESGKYRVSFHEIGSAWNGGGYPTSASKSSRY